MRRPSGTCAMPWATISWAGRAGERRALEDEVARRGATSPEMTRISVVLPAPLGPTTATASPAGDGRSTSHSAVNWP